MTGRGQQHWEDQTIPANRKSAARREPTRRVRPAAEVLEARQLLATIMVNSAGDADGADGGTTLSLRQAIELTNGTLAVSALAPAQARQVVGTLDPTVPTTVDFAIPGTGPFTITPRSQYPPIDNPVIIDGYSQPGTHPNTNGPGLPDNAAILIELSGAGTYLGIYGLTLQGGDSTVQGLAIGGFQDNPTFAGFGGIGILLESPSGDLIRGNFLGLDATGTRPRPNAVGDIGSYGGSHTIGGTAAGDRNVIAGSLGGGPGRPGFGLTLFDSGDLVEGNFIGTDATGARAVPNGIGIEVYSYAPTTIGGTAAGAGNVISGNAVDGLQVFLSGDLVQGNLIGTDLTGTRPLGNSGDGVNLAPSGGYFSASSITIGGTAAGAGNVIADNGGDGVSVAQSFSAVFSDPGTFTGLEGYTLLAGSGQSNTISRNATFGNKGLGIHLLTILESLHEQDPSGAPYIPSPGDLPGANALLRPPTLRAAEVTAAGPLILGSLADTPSTTFLVELFANPDGSGQGKTYLGSALATTDAAGNASFRFASPSILALAGPYVTATVTDPKGNTSEFASPLLVPSSRATVSLLGPNRVATQGRPITFSAVAASMAGGVPTGLVEFLEDGVVIGSAPIGPDGLATFVTDQILPGPHVITAAYAGDVNHLASSPSNAVAVAVFNATAFGGPAVTSNILAGPHEVFVTFNRGLFLVPAQDGANYKIVGPHHKAITITSAVYDPASASVTLTTEEALDPKQSYELTINGQSGDRVVDVFGIALNGQQKGKPGHNYSGKIEVKKAPAAKVAHPKASPKPKAHAAARAKAH